MRQKLMKGRTGRAGRYAPRGLPPSGEMSGPSPDTPDSPPFAPAPQAEIAPENLAGRAPGHWRLSILLGALALIVMIANGWPQALVAPSAAPPPAAPQPPTAPAEAASSPPAAPIDIFATRTWEAPPPPPPPASPAGPPAPPPKPEPPPLPFGYLGQMREPGQPTVIYLNRGSDVLAVKRGDRLAGGYRVGDIRNGQLRFHYLPLNAEQFLPVGSP